MSRGARSSVRSGPGRSSSRDDGAALRQFFRQGETVRFRAGVGEGEGRVGAVEIGERPVDSSGGAQQVPQGDVSDLIEPDSDSEWQLCPEQQCFHTHKKIGQSWLENRNPYGQVWNELVHHKRTLLLEVACGPQSVLSEEVMKQLGPDSAIRCSIWNGYDLTTTSRCSQTQETDQGNSSCSHLGVM